MKITKIHVPHIAILGILFAIDFFYQHTLRHVVLSTSLEISVVEAVLCTLILWITTRFDLAKTTLCFLAIPYLFFIPGWLNTPTAICLSLVFIYCMTCTLRSVNINAASVTGCSSVTLQDLLTFLVVILWVNLSGAGGYGYQEPDYTMHNARLRDLIEYAWPVRFGENQNFVYYVGYFLPSAIIGKLLSLDVALRSMFVWTLFGVILSLRWLGHLSGWRFSIGLVFVFTVFGPMDVMNALTVALTNGSSLRDAISPGSINDLDFVTGYHLGFFLGNYLSNTFQLYWSPQQVIAGWLCISLLTHLFRENNFKQLVFVYALLCLWGPLVMISISPFVVLVVVFSFRKNWPTIISVENILGVGALTVIFAAFYLSGSAGENKSVWLFDAFDWRNKSGVLCLFYLFGWGLYALVVAPYVTQQSQAAQAWFCCLVFTLAILPLRTFGEYSDLLCRGSAPLMFLLLIYLLQALKFYWQHHRRVCAVVLICLLGLGIESAVLQNAFALFYYGKTRSIGHVLGNKYSFENLGSDNSVFERYFSRSMSPDSVNKN